MTVAALLRRAEAFVPLVMSVAAFVLVLAVLATVGISHPPDEGAPARLFQLLIGLQLPIVTLFAVRWLPRSPRTALVVLGLQVGLAGSAVATVAWLESVAWL